MGVNNSEINNSDNKNENNILKMNIVDEEEKKINNTNVSFVSKLIERIKPTVLVFILFFIISIPQINKLIFKILPRMKTSDGSLSILGVILKGIFISLIYLSVSFYI